MTTKIFRQRKISEITVEKILSAITYNEMYNRLILTSDIHIITGSI